MLKNISLYTLSSVLAKSFSLLIIPLIARNLSVEEFGDYIVLVSVVMLIQSTFLFGFEHSLNYFFNKFKAEINKKILVSTQALFILLVSVLCSIPASLLLSDRVENINLILIWGGVSIGLAYFGALLKVEMKVVVFLKSQLLQSVVLFALIYFFVVVQLLALEGILYANIFAITIAVIFICFFTSKYFTFKFSANLLKKVLAYGLPLMPAGLVLWASMQLDRYFILYFLDKYSLGIYAFALAIVMVPLFLKTAVKSAIDPFIMKKFHDKSTNTARYIADYFTLSLFVFSSLFLFLSIFSQDVVMLIGGEKYLQSTPYIPWLLLIACLTTCNQYFVYGINFTKKNGFIFKGLIYMLIINVIMIFILIDLFDVYGVIIASFFANLFYSLYLYKNSNSLYPIEYFLKKNIFIVVSAMVIFLLNWVLFPEGYLFKVLSLLLFVILNMHIYKILRNLLHE